MSRKPSKKLNLDTRNRSDIENAIERLADSYDTGWHMDRERPDIGTALAHVFAGQMEENIDRENEILERYHTEFVNMLDLSLLPARPATGIVIVSLLPDTVRGVGIPKGTKFLTTDDPPYVFEAIHSVYITSSTLDCAFMTDFEEGTLTFVSEEGEIKPFILYGRCDDYPVNEAVFSHPYLFDAQGDELFVKIKGNPEFMQRILDGTYSFYYMKRPQLRMFGDEKAGLEPVQQVTLLDDGETFMLGMLPEIAEEKAAEIAEEEEDEDIEELMATSSRNLKSLLIRANRPVETAVEVDSITFSAKGNASVPESVTNGTNDLEVERFTPFGETLSLYAECFIGADRCFSKVNATVTLTFHLSFMENRVSLTREEVDDSLKIIKRRPSAIRDEAYTDAYIDEIAIEYYNGVGWKRLEIEGAGPQIFDSRKSGDINIRFTCPGDWEPTSAGAFEGRCIRLQITKSDNCYLRPAVHHYPLIRGMQLSYSYDEQFEPATKTELVMGSKEMDISTAEQRGKPYVIFSVSEYNSDALYLGFSNRIESGPASILFEMEEGVRYNGLEARFEYSTLDGFKQIKVIDQTDGFTKTGVVAFVPPSDWFAATLEGEEKYWFRIVRQEKEKADEDPTALPHIRDILLNAVSVANIETREEETVYIEEVVPNMRFTLGATGILDAEVWVNEMGRFSQEAMVGWAAIDPENVRMETDPRGVVTAFFVKWTEVQRFETSPTKRVYRIDRLKNELIFGDGVHTWQPTVLDDDAVRFTVRCCNGAVGNVIANSITDTRDFMMYLGDIYNPIKAYGGSDIESLDNALERGAAILSSRYRLVTLDDYIRAIMAYSDAIDACVGIAGQTVDGKTDESSMTFVLLMKEYLEGSYAFHRVVGGLKRFLLSQCELTVVPDKLYIIEPVFVTISVSVWVNILELDDSFEIQRLLTDALDEYLSPLGYEEGFGWRIGTLPKKPQILMRLGILKSRAIIRKSVMVAQYSDAAGDHEVDIEELKVTPFMVPRSGQHTVHLLN